VIRLARSWHKLALAIGGTLGIAVVLVLAVVYSGVYNVAASRGHPAWLDWFLALGMRRSVSSQSSGVLSPPLDSPDLVRLGGAHFHFGCANCHGAPGQAENPIYDHMLPSPPRLELEADSWTSAQLFWIVRHGIQYAGMPFWSGDGRDDEIWAVVAFLRVLPELDAASYLSLVSGNVEGAPFPAEKLTLLGARQVPVTACARCHDTESRPPTSAFVPRLGGQSRHYLAEALRQYRDGNRDSGFMEPVAAELTDVEIAALARFYAELDSPPSMPAAPSAVTLRRGRELAEKGDPEAGIPPCESCHAAGVLPAYPRLAGQSQAYIEAQLDLWRVAGRSKTESGRLMGTIGARLSAPQVEQGAAHYARLQPFDAGGERLP
jgi:cytochrome c553